MPSLSNSNSEKYLTALLIGLWIAALVMLFVKCGTNPNFWFDESGQFWMSRGQTHFLPPFSPDGGLLEVLAANRTANMDPGGYTVLLHWWMLPSTSPGWLRLFSFLFFPATMAACAGIAYLWSGNRPLALSTGLLPAAAPLITKYACELRPYSMEACGVALSLLLLEYALRRQKLVGFLWLGALSAFFLTSRYSFVCSAAATGIGLLWGARQLPGRRIAAFAAAYALPVFASAVGIYFVTLGHPLSHQKGKPDSYVQDFILQGKSAEQMLVVAKNALFSFPGLVLISFLALYLFCSLRKLDRSDYRLFTTFFVFAAAVNLEFVLLSLLGRYPWCPQERWGITLNLVSVLAIFPLGWMLAKAAGPRAAGGKLAVTLAAVVGVTAIHNVLTTQLSTSETIYANLSTLGPANLAGKYIFVEHTAQPGLRYLYEFGPLKGGARNVYPDSFRFELPPNVNEGFRPFDYLLYVDSIRKGDNL